MKETLKEPLGSQKSPRLFLVSRAERTGSVKRAVIPIATARTALIGLLLQDVKRDWPAVLTRGAFVAVVKTAIPGSANAASRL